MKSKIIRQRVKDSNEEGYVLVTALIMLLLLTMIGLAANLTTTTELQIAGNDKVHKQTFYDADGGTEFAAEVLEQNIACVNFSSAGAGSTDISGGDIALDGNIAVSSGSMQMWQNAIGHWSSSPPYPSDTARDLWYPPVYASGDPHTNMTVEGVADMTPGSSLIVAAGYLGLGRSAAQGGVTLEYEIYSQHLGKNNSESVIRVDWMHVVGREDPHCSYD